MFQINLLYSHFIASVPFGFSVLIYVYYCKFRQTIGIIKNTSTAIRHLLLLRGVRAGISSCWGCFLPPWDWRMQSYLPWFLIKLAAPLLQTHRFVMEGLCPLQAAIFSISSSYTMPCWGLAISWSTACRRYEITCSTSSSTHLTKCKIAFLSVL